MPVLTHKPTNTNDQQKDASKPAPVIYRKLRSRRRYLILVAMLVSAGSLAWIAKGHGFLTSAVRVVYPDYRVASYPPMVITTSPGDGDVDTPIEAPVMANLHVAGCGIDTGSVTAKSVFLFRTGDQKVLSASVRYDNGRITVRPERSLDPLTNYTFYITADMKDAKGRALTPFATTFTTAGSADPDIRFKRIAQPNTKGIGVTALRIGPDGKLWAGSDDGRIILYEILSDGSLGAGQIIKTLQDANHGRRMLMGFDFDRPSTASNPIIWVTNSYYGFTNVPDFTGKVTRMSGANLETVQDAVINLPRSIKDHQTMQPSFGPDGASISRRRATPQSAHQDQVWGMRPEHMLNACILRLDTTRITPGEPVDAKTKDCGGKYDPAAPSAPLTIYATGVRLGYDLVWHSNGHLYVPTNGSDKDGNVPGSTNVPATTKRSDCRR